MNALVFAFDGWVGGSPLVYELVRVSGKSVRNRAELRE